MKKIDLILLIVTCLFFLTSCKDKTDLSGTPEQQLYTCSMHPQVIQDHPGVCPICKMDLVPVTSTNSRNVTLSDDQVELGNIKTERATVQFVGQSYFTNGRLMNDETLTQKISSRVTGRIDKLFIKETGTIIKKGAPIYEIFSEQLQTLQQEFLLSIEQYEILGKEEPRFKKMMQAAEKKLLLYGLSESQLARLKTSRKINERVVVYSPVAGYVSKLGIVEGQYVQEGQSLFEIQNYSNLWVEAELYPSETSMVRTGDQIKVQITGFESAHENATVSFLSPEFKSNTQIVVMRAVLNNPDEKFKPGMQAQVMFTSSANEALAVPVDAVIRNAKTSYVFVVTGNNTFTPREVKTGSENADFAEITEGLKDGEEVVTSGAYLLYSEIVFKKGSDALKHEH